MTTNDLPVTYTYYLVNAATGGPALALTFDTEDKAHDACVEYFGADAWNHSILLSYWT